LQQLLVEPQIGGTRSALWGAFEWQYDPPAERHARHPLQIWGDNCELRKEALTVTPSLPPGAMGEAETGEKLNKLVHRNSSAIDYF
jgi:hypothetical protein